MSYRRCLPPASRRVLRSTGSRIHCGALIAWRGQFVCGRTKYDGRTWLTRDELGVTRVALVDVPDVVDGLRSAAVPEAGARRILALREAQHVRRDLAPFLRVLLVGPRQPARIVDVPRSRVVRGERESIALDVVGNVAVMILELVHVFETAADRLLRIGRVVDA